MQPYRRSTRVADLIQRALAKILQMEANDPRFLGVTVTGVEVSTDIRHAKIFVTVFNEDKAVEVVKALNKAKGYFRRLLAQSVELRTTPELQFVYDKSIGHGRKLASLIDQV